MARVPLNYSDDKRNTVAVIGLGSNLKRPLLQLREAYQRLQHCAELSIKACSSIYQSCPLVPADAPLSWSQAVYLNAAVKILTTLSPQALLACLKKIEAEMGRTSDLRWSPRLIDLDILTFGDLIIHEHDICIPHPELHKRAFAVLPLLEVLPDYSHPTYPDLDLATYIWPDLPKKLPHLLTGPQIVGILNITPDSFSDGGRFSAVNQALLQARKLFETGADVIDIGAESTRPGAVLIDAEREWQRIEPVLKALYLNWKSQEHRPLISIDTRHHKTVERSLMYQIDWVNDVSQFEYKLILPLIKSQNLKYVVMHHCGVPPVENKFIQGSPIIALRAYQNTWLNIFSQHNLDLKNLIFDPGIGFGKTPMQQLEILAHFNEIKIPGLVYLMGHSRKRFLRNLLHQPDPGGVETMTALVSQHIAAMGVEYVRVHDPVLNLAAIKLGQLLATSRC